MRAAWAVMMCVALCACDPPANRQFAKEEEQTTYQFNGTIDGCRLYHVNPRHGSNFQLAICGATAQTNWTEGCGKGCSRDVRVDTKQRAPR